MIYKCNEKGSILELFLYIMIAVTICFGIIAAYNKKIRQKNSPVYIIKSSGEEFQNYPISNKKCDNNVVYLVGGGRSITYTVMVESTGQILTCNLKK